MKTREILKGILFAAGILMLATSCNKKVDEPVLDFDVTVPSTWNYYVLNTDNIVYYASSPVENQNDTITEDIVITKDLMTGKTLEQFSTLVIAQLDDDTTYHQVSLSGDTTINGNVCRKLVHLQTVPVVKTQTHDTIYLYAIITRFFFINNNYGYVVTMNALVSSYPIYQPIFDTVIKSFKFKI